MSANLMPSHLSKLHSQCFERFWKSEQFAGLDIIAEDKKGFVAFQTVVDECEIKTICVLPKFRRQGIAEKLMHQLIAKQAGKIIFLEVEESNLPAIKLYEKLGFKTFSTRKDYYGVGRNALLMKLTPA